MKRRKSLWHSMRPRGAHPAARARGAVLAATAAGSWLLLTAARADTLHDPTQPMQAHSASAAQTSTLRVQAVVNAQNSQPPGAAVAPASEPRLNVDAENAPARAFFMALVDGAPYSMLVHPQVSGSVSIHLKQVTVEQALEAARDLYG